MLSGSICKSDEPLALEVKKKNLRFFYVHEAIIAFSDGMMIIAAPLFIGLDIALVVIQDKFIFGRMFDGYERYRRETPMLLPNKKSFSAFLRSFRQAKSQ